MADWVEMLSEACVGHDFAGIFWFWKERMISLGGCRTRSHTEGRWREKLQGNILDQ